MSVLKRVGECQSVFKKRNKKPKLWPSCKLQTKASSCSWRDLKTCKTHFIPCRNHSSFPPGRVHQISSSVQLEKQVGTQALPKAVFSWHAKAATEAVRHVRRHAHTRTPTHPNLSLARLTLCPWERAPSPAGRSFRLRSFALQEEICTGKLNQPLKESTESPCCLLSQHQDLG